MTVKSLWQSLKTLVDCDKKIFQTEADVKQAQAIIEKNQKQISTLQALLETKKNTCAQERKNVGLFELQAAEFKIAEDEKRSRLGHVKDHKEFKAIEKELQTVSQQRMKHEDALIQGWHALEQATKSFEQETGATQQKIELLHQETIAQQDLIKNITENLEHLTKERTDSAAAIPEEWLTRYNRMQNVVPDPVVPVHGNCCSACFYTIIPQDMANLKKVGMLLCRSCYRFLYLDVEEEKDAKQATY